MKQTFREKGIGLMCLSCCLILSAAFTSCSDNNSGTETVTLEKKEISGSVEKGPFLQGSLVTLHELNASLAQTGKNFFTQTTDDLGSFDFTTAMSLSSRYVELETNGYFFNEVKGERSASQINLRALSDVTDRNSIHVNLLTHLECDRVRRLVSDGKNFSEAKQQAGKELLAVFGIHTSAGLPENISITDETRNASILLAVSTVMLAHRTEAEFSEFIAAFSQDFADNGMIDNELVLDKLHEGERNAKPAEVAGHITHFYAEKGREIHVEDFTAFVDFNGDGTVGNDVYDPAHPVQVEHTSIHAPMEGATYRIGITCDVPLYTSVPGGWDTTVYDPVRQYIVCDMLLAKEYTDGMLTVIVEPTHYRVVRSQTVNLYDAVGNMVVSIEVTQDGNPEGEYLTQMGHDLFVGLLNNLADAERAYAEADARYTGLNNSAERFTMLSPSDSRIEDIWSDYYRVINFCNGGGDEFERYGYSGFLTMFIFPQALAYYRLITLFGDVPLVTTRDVGVPKPRTASAEIFSTFTAALQSVLKNASERKTTNPIAADDFANPSADIIRLLLADIHLYQRDYAQARPLLEAIVHSGHYNLTGTADEIILSVGTESPQVVSTYADVVLSLAECELSTGNSTKANTYIAEVASAKGIATDGTNPLADISKLRSHIHRDVGGYFAFLKRSGLFAESGIPAWQALFPIPRHELLLNPYITQNPGY